MVDVSVLIRRATELLEPVEEALEGAQGLLKDLEFGANGMLAPLNPQLQGLLPLDCSNDRFFQLHLSEVLTVLSGVLSYHLHGMDFLCTLAWLSPTKD